MAVTEGENGGGVKTTTANRHQAEPSSPNLPPDQWYFPNELKADLRNCGVPSHYIQETLVCSWEFVRTCIPQFTPRNYDRYLAFVRLGAIATISEISGDLVDMAASPHQVLGYDADALLHTLFRDTPFHAAMAREWRTYVLLTGEKTCARRNSSLFRRYANTLPKSAQTWFRLRDCDGFCRLTIAAALACNDIHDFWFSEAQLQIFAEITMTLYDVFAYYKHRSEGEIHDTYAYVGEELRAGAFQRCREVLWALDAAAAWDPAMQCAVNFVRFFGGPIHLTMRRYRFLEDGLTLGLPDTAQMVQDARQHVKLWARLDKGVKAAEDDERYAFVAAQNELLLFPELLELLEQGLETHCAECVVPAVYGAPAPGEWGGAKLCGKCKMEWKRYMESLLPRAMEAFSGLRAFMAQRALP
ncbi:hypothetical protein OQA88_11621 [Cercophora sp. LCS_1]